MPIDPVTGHYVSPRYQLKTSQGKPGGYPLIDADGDVLNGRGEKVGAASGGVTATRDGDTIRFSSGATRSGDTIRF